ncbi:unnamed protein product, partial [Effrenium voratum]
MGEEEINWKDGDGLTLLDYAAVSGMRSLCAALLWNPDFQHVEPSTANFTPLHWAASCGQAAVCHALLEHPRFLDMAGLDGCGRTALHIAAQSGHAEVCRVLLKHPRFIASMPWATPRFTGLLLLGMPMCRDALCVCAVLGLSTCFAYAGHALRRQSLVDGRVFGTARSSRVIARNEDPQGGSEVQTIGKSKKAASSKTEMLRFALPALGIYLANPIMSNIDNSFVGHFGGTAALAALSPGGVLADNLSYLFNSVLTAATTGLVARAWPKGAKSASEELTRTFSFALAVGLPLTLFYIFCSKWALGLMGVGPEIQSMAASYAQIRGTVAWASIGQSVCLSAILATRDAVTPLKVVFTAA